MAVWAVSLLTTELIPRSLTAAMIQIVFGVYLDVVSIRTQTHTVLYPYLLQYDAVPKYISRRTSYLQVRLVFRPYPQLITQCCSSGVFGPPLDFTQASAWPWIDHLVSGLGSTTNFGLLILAFTTAPAIALALLYFANSLAHSTKGTPSPRRAPTPCKHMISGSISLPSPGFF